MCTSCWPASASVSLCLCGHACISASDWGDAVDAAVSVIIQRLFTSTSGNGSGFTQETRSESVSQMSQTAQPAIRVKRYCQNYRLCG